MTLFRLFKTKSFQLIFGGLHGEAAEFHMFPESVRQDQKKRILSVRAPESLLFGSNRKILFQRGKRGDGFRCVNPVTFHCSFLKSTLHMKTAGARTFSVYCNSIKNVPFWIKKSPGYSRSSSYHIQLVSNIIHVESRHTKAHTVNFW